jgi:O-antigen ligase
MAAVALVSALVTVPAEAARQMEPVWRPLLGAMVIAECALLGWATERLVRQQPEMATRLIAIGLIGHAAAALLNVDTVLGVAMRSGDFFGSLVPSLMTIRFSAQTEVHAAASALLLAAVAGMGLFVPSWRGIAVIALIGIIGVGMWITGSRVEMVLALVSIVLAIGWSLTRSTAHRRVAIAAVLIGALGAGLVLALSLRTATARYGTVQSSGNARLVLYQAGLEMFAKYPVFGIGIGKFYVSSPEFLRGKLGPNYRENAHNNFIQVLAEQGVVGFAALAWWIGAVVFAGITAEMAGASPGRATLLLAIIACIGTWMIGHPLLVPEFAFVFWLYCGILAGTTPLPAPTNRRWLLWAAIAVVVLTAFPRQRALRASADLQYKGLRVSVWRDDDTQRYREALPSFALFLPATGRPIDIPFRRTREAPDPLLVEVSISERAVQHAYIAGESWQTISVVVPASSERFTRVDFFVHSGSAGTPVERNTFRIGKEVAR